MQRGTNVASNAQHTPQVERGMLHGRGHGWRVRSKAHPTPPPLNRHRQHWGGTIMKQRALASSILVGLCATFCIPAVNAQNAGETPAPDQGRKDEAQTFETVTVTG